MNAKKKREKERIKTEIRKRGTVLEDGSVVLEGRYLVLPDGKLRDLKHTLDKMKAERRKA